jgi:DsbC/DsbD-like thiol-disulfide interchange protein
VNRAIALAVLLALVLAGALPPAAHAAASAWEENPHSAVRLITPYEVAPRDGEVWLGLHFRLIPHWHVYWKNSGDAGYAPAIDLSATPDIGEAELLYPAPERYELPGDLVSFGYGEEVVYPVRGRIAAAGKERVEISAALDYLVCEVECVPYAYTLVVDQPVGREMVEDPGTAALLETWKARLPRPVAEVPGVETDARLDLSDLERPLLLVTVTGARPAPDRRPDLFLEVHDLFEPGTPTLEEAPDGLRFRVPLELKRTVEEAPRSSPFAWTVTGLADPEAPGGVLAVEARRTVPASLEAAPAAPSPEPSRRAARWGRLLEAPAWVAALTVAALLVALRLWGVLGRRPAPGTARSRRGEALGFLVAGAVVGLLYLLSGWVSSEGLAFVELSLLGVGLAAWARSRTRRPAARAFWAALLAAAALAAVWLAAAG